MTWITPSVDKAQVLQFAEGYFWLFYPQSSCFLNNAQKLSFYWIYPFINWEVRWFLESFLCLDGLIQIDHVDSVADPLYNSALKLRSWEDVLLKQWISASLQDLYRCCTRNCTHTRRVTPMQNRHEQWGQQGCTMTRNNICWPSGCSFPFTLNLIDRELLVKGWFCSSCLVLPMHSWHLLCTGSCDPRAYRKNQQIFF